MDVLQILVLLAALGCALVGGLVLTFAVVVMPGIRSLDNREYLRAFKVMDRVIQANSPVFLLVWLGSAVAAVAATVLGIWQLAGLDRVLVTVAGSVFLLGVHLPTVIVNIPINNQLQSANLEALNDTELHELAQRFETRWIRWNLIRTVVAIASAALFLVLLGRL